MTLTAIQPPPAAPSRVLRSSYTAVVFDANVTVLDEDFEHASARRDAVVQLLLSNHDEVSSADVDEVLRSFGGADADVALAHITELYTQKGVDITVHLGEHLRDLGPAVLYTSFTDYGDGTTFIEHYPTRAARLASLRDRAAILAEDRPLDFFADADEETCRSVIQYALLFTHGRVYLAEAERHNTAESYAGNFPEE